MENATSIHDSGPVLVSDFDGTMTRHDFYKLAIERLLPRDVPDYWAKYRAGEMTHFEGLRRYFADIRESEEDVLEIVRQMELDPDLPNAVEQLMQAGWQVVVTSAGCEWYIRQLLSEAKVDVIVHANPGRFEAGQGLAHGDAHGFALSLPDHRHRQGGGRQGLSRSGAKDRLCRGWLSRRGRGPACAGTTFDSPGETSRMC